jgi:hypothetical protein
MPFGYGEVEPADGRNSTAVAQLIFIGRIQEDVPQVIADLADMPLQENLVPCPPV